MRAVLYQRVSQDRAQGRSVSEQEAENRAAAQRQGWEIVDSFTDNDLSASRYARKARPEWKQLLLLLQRGEVDALVTWEASRSTRDLEAYVQLRDICRKYGVSWCYNGRLYDLSRADDSFSTGLDILLAEKEADQTRERIMRSVRANVASGRPHGKRPYGYTRTYDQSTGQMTGQIIREDQAAIIREAAKRFVAGDSCTALAKDFNRRNLPTPHNGIWDTTRIKRLITNPIYIGMRTHKDKVVGPGQWPAILDEAIFYQCVAKANDPSRKTVRDSSVKHLLSGIARCGVCGGRVQVYTNRGKWKSYQCRPNHCVARAKSLVDDLITELLITRLEQPDAAILFKPQTPDNRELLDRITTTRSRLEGFCDAAAEGELTPQALGRIEAKLLAEIETLERKLRRTDLPLAVHELAKNPREVWEQLPIAQRREVIRVLMDIRIMKSPKGNRHSFKPEFIEIIWRGQDVAESAELVSA